MVLSIINRRPTQFEGTQRVWPNLRQPYALWLLADWTLNMVSGWCLQSPHSATHNIFSFVWFVHYFFFPIDVAWTLFLQLLRRASQSRFCHFSCACIAVIGQWYPGLNTKTVSQTRWIPPHATHHLFIDNGIHTKPRNWAASSIFFSHTTYTQTDSVISN